MYLLKHSFTSPDFSYKEINGIFEKSETVWNVIKELVGLYIEKGYFKNTSVNALDVMTSKDKEVATIYLLENEDFLEFEMSKIVLEQKVGIVVHNEKKQVFAQ